MTSRTPGKKKRPHPYRAYSAFLKNRFGDRVHRVALDAGFGCPHRNQGRGGGGCIYCNKYGSGSNAFDQGHDIREQMSSGIERLSRLGIKKYVAYFQAFCGTAADPEILRSTYLDAAAFSGVVGLSIGTRPDLVPDEVLNLLSGFARGDETGRRLDVWLELGLQSANDTTLKRIRRGHDTACFDDAVRRAAGSCGLSVAAHAILGLPGEGEKQMMATAEHLGRLPINGVKLHHLYVEKGTELERLYQRGGFKPLSLDEYVRLAIAFVRRLKKDVVIMRLAGSCEQARLVAPSWGMRSSAIAQRIEREMAKEGWRQGDLGL